jgi:hypothetical protein
VWPLLYTPGGKLKYEKLNYRSARFADLLTELLVPGFSGYVEILALHEHGLLLFHRGQIRNGFYEGTEDLQLSPQDVIRHFMATGTSERETVLNVGELAPAVLEALGALTSRTPAHRELETTFLDLPKLFTTFARKRFTGTLRFYRIRSNTRLGNLLLRLNKITADQLREAIRLQLSGVGALRLGDALVKTGAIRPQDLEEALNRQSNTRKGSDLEVALALFHDGDFLGGYTSEERQLVTSQTEVLTWLNKPELLMDIIEGLLPPPVDAQTVLGPGQVAPAPKAEAQPAAKASEPQAIAPAAAEEETLSFKADDLILDIRDNGEKAPPPSAAYTENLAWLQDLPSAEPMAAEPLVAAAELQPLQGLAALEFIADKHMGFLGRALLEREKKKVEISGRGLNAAQLKNISGLLFQSARLVLGAAAAEAMVQEIEANLERK